MDILLWLLKYTFCWFVAALVIYWADFVMDKLGIPPSVMSQLKKRKQNELLDE